MSTDHQRYSTENQRDALQRYADEHGMIVVQTYADDGKSGLSIEGRSALQQLIRDVESGQARFKAVLVYDVSRWGRFQDADESAFYEYRCRRAGIDVVYCGESFANDGSPAAVIMKSVKRAMAGEYSRELSTKVFIGQCRLVELGFRQGGPAGFGLQRVLLDDLRQLKGILNRGQRKSLQTDRVVLAPGAPEEVAVVQTIYDRFVRHHEPESVIAEALNARGLRTDRGTAWTRGMVHQVLTNEKYIGNNVYNRTSFKLKQTRVRNPPDMWVRADGVFPGIVAPDLFAEARAIIAERSVRLDDETMIDSLRRLFATRGTLSGLLIDEQDDMPSSSAYRSRFGSLLRAYSLVGYRPRRDFRYLEINKALRKRLPHVIEHVIEGLTDAGGTVRRDPENDLLRVNDEFSVSVAIARCQRTPAGSYRWRVRFDTSLSPDITVVIRMASDHEQMLDYYVFTSLDFPAPNVKLSEHNEFCLDAYRFDSLDVLYALAERVPLQDAA